MIYQADYIDGFREFARKQFTETPPGEPFNVDINIDDERMLAWRTDRPTAYLIADPPFFGYVDRFTDGSLNQREMCETANKYAEQIAEACKWAEESPADRSVKADVLNYAGHYATKVTVSRERSGGPAGVPTRASLG